MGVTGDPEGGECGHVTLHKDRGDKGVTGDPEVGECGHVTLHKDRGDKGEEKKDKGGPGKEGIGGWRRRSMLASMRRRRVVTSTQQCREMLPLSLYQGGLSSGVKKW